MKNRPSRRDFAKVAIAASLGGVAASAEKTGKAPMPDARAGKSETGAQSNQSAVVEEIGFPRVHTGHALSRVSCPLGGIGTGGIGLGGRGNLQDWQIFNRPNIGNALEYSFPSLWVRSSGDSPYSAVLEGDSCLPTTSSRKGWVLRTFRACLVSPRRSSSGPS